ncbi:hypothetical protein BJ912DRAFT_926910 [Pholiota molesta]|nr:hypothetical protein BJ912DRAFT_926910 [Pholiota molesta]
MLNFAFNINTRFALHAPIRRNSHSRSPAHDDGGRGGWIAKGRPAEREIREPQDLDVRSAGTRQRRHPKHGERQRGHDVPRREPLQLPSRRCQPPPMPSFCHLWQRLSHCLRSLRVPWDAGGDERGCWVARRRARPRRRQRGGAATDGAYPPPIRSIAAHGRVVYGARPPTLILAPAGISVGGASMRTHPDSDYGHDGRRPAAVDVHNDGRHDDGSERPRRAQQQRWAQDSQRARLQAAPAQHDSSGAAGSGKHAVAGTATASGAPMNANADDGLADRFATSKRSAAGWVHNVGVGGRGEYGVCDRLRVRKTGGIGLYL